MLKIGLTGGIGSGKSTVEKLFSELGAPLIDADTIAYAVSLPDGAAYADLQQLLPHDIFLSSGEIDRKILRKLAFSNPTILTRLEKIIHPLVAEEIKQFYRSQTDTTAYVIISVPLLIESGMQDLVDRILVVDCTPEQQLDRVTERDNSSQQSIQKIIDQQLDRQTRLGAADDIIDNTGDFCHLKNQVLKLDKLYHRISEQ